MLPRCQRAAPSFAVTLALTWAAAQEPLPLTNAGFENGLDGWSKKIEPAEPNAISTDTGIFHSGKASLRISQKRSSSYSNVSQAVPVEPYHNYIARCTIKAENVKRSGIGLNLFIGDVRGMGIRSLEDESDREGTFDWREVVVPFNSGRHDRIAVFPYLHESTGTVWFDDIQVIPVATGWKPPEGAEPREHKPGPRLPDGEQFNYDALSMDVVTPHRVWARPLPGGPLRALIIAPAWSQRESVELAQRCDIEPTALMTLTPTTMGSDQIRYGILTRDEAERMALEKADRDYDVIIIGRQKWESLPEAVRGKLLAKIEAGCGLVWVVGPDDDPAQVLGVELSPAPEIAAALPLASLPAFSQYGTDAEAAEAVVRAGRLGAGRVVVLDYGEETLAAHHYLTPATYAAPDGSWLHYEYYQALLVRAVCAAAGRESKVRIEALEVPALGADPAPIRVSTSASEAGDFDFEFTVRSADGTWVQPLDSGEEPVAAGRATMDLPLICTLPTGPCFVELRLRDLDGVLAFAAAVGRIDRGVAVENVRLSADSVEPGEGFTVSASIRGGMPPNTRALVSAIDNHGRQWFSKTVPVRGDAVSAEIPATGSLSVLNRVAVQVAMGDQVWAEGSAPLLVRHPFPVEDFSFVLWNGTGSDYIGFRLMEIMARDYGAHVVDMGAGPWMPDPLNEASRQNLVRMLDAVAAANLRPLPYISRIWSEKIIEEDLIRQPCLSDPAYRQAFAESLAERAAICRRYAPAGYTLGDECFVATGADVCFSEHCVADFPRFLQARHESPEGLSSAWGKPAAWGEAAKLPLAQAREQGQPAAWVDHRLHMEERFADTVRLGRETIRNVDPDARVGFDGAFATGNYTGYDWWALSREMDLWNVYWQKNQHLAMQSFAKPDTLSGLWYGGYVYGPAGRAHAHGVRWLPWYSLAHGMTGAWFYSPYTRAGGSGEVAFGPDFRPFPCWSESAREIAEIRRGPGRLLLTAERFPAQVGLVYSPASLHASKFHKLPVAHITALTHIAEILDDLCVPYRLIADAELPDAAIGCRALWLPATCALSEAAASALTTFCERGGLVIADVVPAAYTESGALLGEGRLDKLFGVRRSGPVKMEPSIGGIDGYLPVTDRDTGTALADGKAAGESEGTPVLIQRQAGRGRAFLFNFSLDGYKELRGPMGRGVRGKVLELLQGAGVERPVVLSVGEDVPDQVQVAVFQAAGNLYALAVRHPEASWEPQTVDVKFAKAGHLYDCRAGKYLGETGSAQAEMMPGDARLWALLPERIRGLSLDAPDEVKQGSTLELKVRLQRTTDRTHHVLHVDVEGADGQALPWLSQNVVARRPQATIPLPIALNDVPGEYQATLRDVATGIESSMAWQVAER